MAKYKLSDIFEGDYPISQQYGVNASYYQQPDIFSRAIVPSHWKSFIPTMTQFESFALSFSNLHSYFRISIALMRAKSSVPIRICHKFITTLLTYMRSLIVVKRLSTKTNYPSFFIYFWVVFKGVLTMCGAKSKIVNRVILLISINVVNYLLSSKISTDMLFHYNAMFGYVSLLSRKGMTFIKNIPISAPIYFIHTGNNTGAYYIFQV